MSNAILVPLDGSHVSEAAIPFAVWLSDATHAAITLVTVLDGDDRGEAAPEAARSHLESIAARIRVDGRSVTTQVGQGKAAGAVAESAAAADVSYVVLTTYARGGDSHHLGGTADRLSRTLPKPALFISPSSDVEAPITGPLLLALDGSTTAESALGTAQTLASQVGLPLKLVRVAPWANELFAAFTGLAPPSADEEIELGSNTYLAALVETMPNTIDSDYQTLRGHAAQMLMEYGADQRGILVLCSHGESANPLWHLGGTTEKVLRASAAPVLLVPVARMR